MFFATYTPPQKTDCSLFAACGRQTLRGFYNSYGACGCTGGIFYDYYCVWGGTDKILPVDVYIPGCPPSPAQTIYGFAMALGLLRCV